MAQAVLIPLILSLSMGARISHFSKVSMSRIMIFGKAGSGKSTLSVQLSKKLNLPLYHIDQIFFVESTQWIERDYQEFLDLQQRWVNKDKWIIDGNGTRSFEMRYQRATIAIYLNYSRWLCFWRILKRNILKNRIDPVTPGRVEGMPWRLIKYTWGFENRVRDKLAYLKKTYPGVAFYEVHSDKELKSLKNRL